MRAQDRTTARRSLDRKLDSLRNSDALQRPARGWIRAIREALGMTAAQLGKRMEVNQSTVAGFEYGEVSKAITLDSLERAANALDCRLVYAVVPRSSFEDQVLEQARRRAPEEPALVARLLGPGAEPHPTPEGADLERFADELVVRRCLWSRPPAAGLGTVGP